MTPITDQLKTKTQYMTLQAVALLLGSHEMTLRKWAKRGKIPAVRIGDQIKFDPAAVVDWLRGRALKA
jgi:excisionase family DNA binding protein